MCGMTSIFCFKPIASSMMTDVCNFMKEAAYVGSVRGRDSTGIMYLPRGVVQSPSVIKRAVDGAMFIDMFNAKSAFNDIEKYMFSVVHNRKATLGGVSDNTAHPFQVEHITLVHNGTLTNHRSLPRGGDSSQDSKAIACALNTVGADKATEILEQLAGAYVIIWHDTRDNSINVARNSQRPWAAAFVDKEPVLLGASEAPMLAWLAARNDLSIGKIFEPAVHTQYKWLLEEADVRNYHSISYTPTPASYNPYSHYAGYNRASEDAAATARLKRFEVLEKLGFKRGDRITFESYEFTGYGGSPSKGIIKAYDDTYTFDVEAYNVDRSLYAEGHKLSGTISYVKDTPSFPEWLTVIVDGVTEVKEEEPVVKKSRPLVLVSDKSVESEVAQMMQKEQESESLVAGPGGVLIPLNEYHERTKTGCGNCSCDLPTPSDVTWTFMEDPLCSECSEVLDNNLVSLLHNVGHC